VARLYSAGGTMLGSVTMATESSSVPGWQQAVFSAPIPIAANTTYVAAYYAPGGQYSDTWYGLTSSVSNGPLTAPAASHIGGNGVWVRGLAFPTYDYLDGNFFVDVAFTSVAPAYFVARTGNDNNPGTISAPFATLGRCQAAMESGSVKLCYVRGGTYTNLTGAIRSCNGTSALVLRDAQGDSGTTYSYYPTDGVDSAIFDGGAYSQNSGANNAICITDAHNITINGLVFRNYNGSAINLLSSHNNGDGIANIIENNEIYNVYGIAITSAFYSQGTAILNNYIWGVPVQGISVSTTQGPAPGGISNDVIANNVIYDVCTAYADCGAIYIKDYQTPPSTNIKVKGNYIHQVGASSSQAGVGLYLDDGTSNVTLTDNVIVSGGSLQSCALIHGGINDVFLNNVCDLGSASASFNDGGTILFYQTSPQVSYNMTGNVWANNIVVCLLSSACGGGYWGSGPPPTSAAVANNIYYNYGSGGAVNHGGSGGQNGDSSPIYANPNLQCWAVALPGQPAPSYGPPRLVLPTSGTPPSWPHNC
jgi:hypothetical protein